MMLERPFSLSFFEFISEFLLCGRLEFGEYQVGWALPWSLLVLWARWVALGPLLFMFLSTVDH
jgi:hypothetical protein